MKMTQSQFDTAVKDFSDYAREPVSVEFSAYYFLVLGSELAILRIANKCKGIPAGVVSNGYSENLKSYYFRLHIPGCEGSMSNKKKLSIQIIWSENGYLHDLSIERRGCSASVFKSFEEIDHELTVGASMRKAGGGYHKTKFIVTYGTEQYEGRFDLHAISEKQETSTGQISLHQHMKDRCTYAINNPRKHIDTNVKQRWLGYLSEIEQGRTG